MFLQIFREKIQHDLLIEFDLLLFSQWDIVGVIPLVLFAVIAGGVCIVRIYFIPYFANVL